MKKWFFKIYEKSLISINTKLHARRHNLMSKLHAMWHNYLTPVELLVVSLLLAWTRFWTSSEWPASWHTLPFMWCHSDRHRCKKCLINWVFTMIWFCQSVCVKIFCILMFSYFELVGIKTSVVLHTYIMSACIKIFYYTFSISVSKLYSILCFKLYC